MYIIRTAYYIHCPWRAKKNFCCFICVSYGPYTLLQNDSFFTFICITVGQYFNWYRASRRSLANSWASCYQIWFFRTFVHQLTWLVPSHRTAAGGLMFHRCYFLCSFDNGWKDRNAACCVNIVDEKITTATNYCSLVSPLRPCGSFAWLVSPLSLKYAVRWILKAILESVIKLASQSFRNKLKLLLNCNPM